MARPHYYVITKAGKFLWAGVKPSDLGAGWSMPMHEALSVAHRTMRVCSDGEYTATPIFTLPCDTQAEEKPPEKHFEGRKVSNGYVWVSQFPECKTSCDETECSEEDVVTQLLQDRIDDLTEHRDTLASIIDKLLDMGGKQ